MRVCPDCDGEKTRGHRIVFHKRQDNGDCARGLALVNLFGFGDVRLVGEVRDRPCPRCGGEGFVGSKARTA